MLYRPDLSKVAILIKTFLRDHYLAEAIASIQGTLPEAQLIIVDDGDPSALKQAMYQLLKGQGHVTIQLPFDSGFGAKSNAGTEKLERPYVLIGSDDFDFRPAAARKGIERLVAVLDGDEDVHIASGRVNGNRYEGWLHENGGRVVEEYIQHNYPCQVNGVTYYRCDLTVNYSLIRSSILGPDKIHWDDDVKIGGGEHGAFFLDVKHAGHGVAWVTDVNITEQAGKLTDPRYSIFRGRAGKPGRPCFARRGVKEYVMFGGGIERA